MKPSRSFVGAMTGALLSLPLLAGPAAAGGGPVGPTITTTTPTNSYLLNKDLSLNVEWTASDPDGIGHHISLFAEKAFDDQSYQLFARADLYTGTDEAAQEVSLGPGRTGCLVIGAEDTAQNTGYASDHVCFAAPLDDAEILKSGGWDESFARGSYLNTISATKKQGQTMSVRGAFFTNLAIVVTKGPGYGKIRVSDDDGHIDATYSLAAAEVKKKALIKVPVPEAVQQAQPEDSITIRVVTDDKPVKIDGVGLLDRRLPV